MDVDIEAVLEQLLIRHEEALFLFNDATDEIRQPAVGEGNEGAPVKDDDLRLFIHAPQPRRTGRPAGHSSHDEDSLAHAWPPFTQQAAWGRRLFHGMRASSIPIPQVSVIPAKTSPAPTNPERANHAGLTRNPSTTPGQHEGTRRDAHLALERHDAFCRE